MSVTFTLNVSGTGFVMPTASAKSVAVHNTAEFSNPEVPSGNSSLSMLLIVDVLLSPANDGVSFGPTQLKLLIPTRSNAIAV